MTPDAILLERYCAERDAEAFTELVHRHAGLVFGACRRICGNSIYVAIIYRRSLRALVSIYSRSTFVRAQGVRRRKVRLDFTEGFTVKQRIVIMSLSSSQP